MVPDQSVGAWRPWDMGDPFEAGTGTIFRDTAFVPTSDELVRIGFRVEHRHCNFAGGCHGGMIATLLDIALGRNVLALTDAALAPTVSLTIDFTRGAMEGDWLESRTRIVRRTRRLVFCDATLEGAKGTVARASGIFALPAS